MGPPQASPDRFLDRFLPYLLARAAHSAAGAFHADLRRRGVAVPVWRVLAALSDTPGETVTALAAACLLQQPTMTKLLDRMERDGWIRRSSDTTDRRRKLIEALPASKPAWTKIIAAAKRVRTRATRGLTTTQLAQLKKLLRLVQSNLDEPSAQRAAS